MSDTERVVPCRGCVRCCRGDVVRILPHEDASRWQTEPHPYVEDARMLAHKDNGDCIYLGEHGCANHEHRPQQCREMDCRVMARRFNYTQALNLGREGVLSIEVWRKGRDLLRQQGGRP